MSKDEKKKKRKVEKNPQKKREQYPEAKDLEEGDLETPRKKRARQAEVDIYKLLPGSVTSRDKKKKKLKKSKKKEKKRKREAAEISDNADSSNDEVKQKKGKINHTKKQLEQQKEQEHSTITDKPSRIVASSAIEFYDEQIKHQKTSTSQKAQMNFALSLLLFYQYIEPVWDDSTYNFMLTTLQKLGKDLHLTGRMRVAREGLNCTLTGSHESIVEYCKTLRRLRPLEFANTEFKLTSDLPQAQKFSNLKVFNVVELVHYGLEGSKAPPIAKFSGTHLEPEDYHKKISESNTVVIDVRNHYEAAIGRFVPPTEGHSVKNGEEPPKWLNPKMRKSTEFPVWLDKPEIQEEMKGKQVLMYCTGTSVVIRLYPSGKTELLLTFASIIHLNNRWHSL
jgi:hypothetical protein